MRVTVRLVADGDAAALAELVVGNRDFLAGTDPDRPAEYFTTAGQRREIADQLAGFDAQRLLPCVVEVDGVLAGRVGVSQILYRSFCSGILGYWIRQDLNGRGVATAAVAQVVDLAFGPWGLHRLEAGTLVDNVGSQRVLQRNGFVRFGLAPRYLHIAGAWRDHVLFQRLNEPPPETAD